MNFAESSTTPLPSFKPMGYVRTPFINSAPRQPHLTDNKPCKIILDPEYSDSLFRLNEFSHIYVLAWLTQAKIPPSMHVIPPWDGKTEVGLFASRSPNRINPIGLSIVQLIAIHENELTISSIDFFDKTPILDIKPYIHDLDCKTDANQGWLTEHGNRDHLNLHIRGIAHSQEE